MSLTSVWNRTTEQGYTLYLRLKKRFRGIVSDVHRLLQNDWFGNGNAKHWTVSPIGRLDYSSNKLKSR